MNKVCVSLSGGVDSMVLLHTIVYEGIQNVSAIHINYNNRDTCNSEVQFVQDYCDKLGVELFVKHITEMNRKRDSSRKEYEALTREIRFEEYRKQNCPILLGHNYEDTVENIISNIASKKNYHNLRGMNHETTERGVLIRRPFLEISKKDIYKYAEEHGIPHLTDSTPKWSRRGKLRDHVIPALETCEPNFIKGLLQIANDLEQNISFIQDHPESVTLPTNFVNVKNALYTISNKTVHDYVRRVKN